MNFSTPEKTSKNLPPNLLNPNIYDGSIIFEPTKLGEAQKELYHSFLKRIKFDGKVQENLGKQLLFKKGLFELINNPVGHVLIGKILKLLSINKDLLLIIKEGSKTLISPKEDKIILEISFNDIIFFDQKTWSLTECLGYHDKGWYCAGSCLSPYYLTIAHELIHLKHFLYSLYSEEEKTMIGYHYLGALKADDPKDLDKKEERELVYEEISERQRKAWPNFEERRTVIGPDIDGISELTLRVAGQLPIRYLYQGKQHFLEKKENIEKVFQILDEDLERLFVVHGVKLQEQRKGYYAYNEFLDFSCLTHKISFMFNFFEALQSDLTPLRWRSEKEEEALVSLSVNFLELEHRRKPKLSSSYSKKNNTENTPLKNKENIPPIEKYNNRR